MAVTITKIGLNSEEPVTFKDVTTAGEDIEFACKDMNTVILLRGGSSASTATIKAGNALQGVTEKVVSIPASTTVAVRIESGKFKTIDGKINIKPSATIEVAIIEHK